MIPSHQLTRILHDWGDEKGLLLLKRIYESLSSGGGLLIAEKLLGPHYVGAHMQSLQTMMPSRQVVLAAAMFASSAFAAVAVDGDSSK